MRVGKATNQHWSTQVELYCGCCWWYCVERQPSKSDAQNWVLAVLKWIVVEWERQRLRLHFHSKDVKEQWNLCIPPPRMGSTPWFILMYLSTCPDLTVELNERDQRRRSSMRSSQLFKMRVSGCYLSIIFNLELSFKASTFGTIRWFSPSMM